MTPRPEPLELALEKTGPDAGVFTWNSNTRLDDITDGTSQTMLTGELITGGVCTIRGTHSYDEGPVFSTSHTPNDRTPDETRWCDSSDGPGSPAPCDVVNDGNNAGTLGARFNLVVHTSRSFHAGGVNVGMCDGSVRFAENTISLLVWQAMGTPDGGEVLSDE